MARGIRKRPELDRPLKPVELLALDVDGTILDRSGKLVPIVRDAVREAQAAGIRIVLCTGRRFRRASAIAAELGIDSPMVCNSGALVKCPTSARTLWRADHSAGHTVAILESIEQAGIPALSFLDADLVGPDFVTAAEPSGCPLFDQYLQANKGLGTIDPEWQTPSAIESRGHFHVCGSGTREAMTLLERSIHDRLPEANFRTFVQKSPNYVAWMCEVLRSDANKWTALRIVSDGWEIAPENICAVGDDSNDVPMLAEAGWAVAMGHAEPEIRSHAHWVAPSNAEHGVADVVRIALESRR
jgi:Cof subfamily protein (haloacid dehalogenase superfamily)